MVDGTGFPTIYTGDTHSESEATIDISQLPATDNPYLYEDEGLGSEIDVAILKNANDKIKKLEALATAITYFGTEQENLILHSFYADIKDDITTLHSDYDVVARHYGTEILSSLMRLYLQSEQKIDLSQLLQGIEFNPESDADLDSLVARFEFLTAFDMGNDWYSHTDWLRTHINSIDLNVVKRLLFD